MVGDRVRGVTGEIVIWLGIGPFYWKALGLF